MGSYQQKIACIGICIGFLSGCSDVLIETKDASNSYEGDDSSSTTSTGTDGCIVGLDCNTSTSTESESSSSTDSYGCLSGYEWNGNECADINECADGSHSCGENAACTNTEGAFLCTCNEGYVGDGNVCGFTSGYKVALGDNHTCSINESGILNCWGDNDVGQVGDGTQQLNIDQPTSIGTDKQWLWVTAGIWHTCAIQVGGNLWCWGNNSVGQIGDGTTEVRNAPTQVGIGLIWVNVFIQHNRTCAIQANGTLWCWGGKMSEEDGILVPTQIGSNTDWLFGNYGFAYKKDGSIWKFSWEESANNSEDWELNVTPFETTEPWETVCEVGEAICGIQEDNSLWCWGYAAYWSLASVSEYYYADEPMNVEPSSTWNTVVINTYGSTFCAIKTDGTLWCWGENYFGQAGADLGNNESDNGIHTPNQVGTDNDWYGLPSALGNEHSCATKMDGSLWCWGNNSQGQLGIDKSTALWTYTPTMVEF